MQEVWSSLFQNTYRSGYLDCSMLHNLFQRAVKIPCFFVWMFSIRRMSLDCHPGFDGGGILWFQNLTATPEGALGCIFPILIGGLHYLNVQVSFQNIKLAQTPGIFGLLAKYYKLYLDILTLPILLIAFNIPQGSLVYWVTNSSLTLAQQLCFKHPTVRKAVGLPATAPDISKENRSPEKYLSTDDQASLEETSPERLLQLALQHMNMKSPDKALPLLRLATERDPELVKAYIALGQVSCSRGSLEEAAEYFELALSKSKEHEADNIILASFGAGFSRINQGKKEEGIEHLRRISLMNEPENPTDKASYYTALVLLGSTLYNEGDKVEAAKYLRMAVSYDPGVQAYLKQCEEEEKEEG
ncbi:ALBINO3-like protein 2, chloroplastic isoform X2 [Wolffia australiana]